MTKQEKIPYGKRCKTHFERSTPGKRYVNARWQCPRQALKGLPYCSYCEPWAAKKERLAAKRALASGQGKPQDVSQGE